VTRSALRGTGPSSRCGAAGFNEVREVCALDEAQEVLEALEACRAPWASLRFAAAWAISSVG
jgi:hypothetical protein